MSDVDDSIVLTPISRGDVARGLIFLLSLFLIFLSFSSDDFLFGLISLCLSLVFLLLLFWKSPISVSPSYFFERFGDNLGYYLDNFEAKICNYLQAKKKSEKVLVGVAFNFLLVMAFVLPLDILFQYLTREENSLLFYQQFLTWVIYVVESVFGISVHIRGENHTILAYENMIDMEIVSECTGLHETIFLSLLILCFRGVKPMVRVKWSIYAVIFIFIENLIRIISGYPLIHIYGFSTWDKFHYFWWHTGQYALIMSMFVLWVMVIAGNPKNKSVKKNFER